MFTPRVAVCSTPSVQSSSGDREGRGYIMKSNQTEVTIVENVMESILRVTTTIGLVAIIAIRWFHSKFNRTKPAFIAHTYFQCKQAIAEVSKFVRGSILDYTSILRLYSFP